MFPDLVPFTWERPSGEAGSWELVGPSRPGDSGVFRIVEAEEAPPLPVEFFARELLEADPGDAAALMVEFGPLVSPLRLLLGFRLTASPQALFGSESIASWLDETNSAGGGVSMAEAAAALGDLQAMARAALRAATAASVGDLGSGDLQWLRQLSACRTPGEVLAFGGLVLGPWESSPETFRLTRAICNQMAAFLMDPAPARECANEKCGRIFKRKRGRAQYLGHGDSLYCCTQCETAQRQREFRRRKKSGNGNVNGGDAVRR